MFSFGSNPPSEEFLLVAIPPVVEPLTSVFAASLLNPQKIISTPAVNPTSSVADPLVVAVSTMTPKSLGLVEAGHGENLSVSLAP